MVPLLVMLLRVAAPDVFSVDVVMLVLTTALAAESCPVDCMLVATTLVLLFKLCVSNDPLFCMLVNVPAVPFMVVPLIDPLLTMLFSVACPVVFSVALVMLVLLTTAAKLLEPVL
jgi:hypothetical protein